MRYYLVYYYRLESWTVVTAIIVAVSRTKYLIFISNVAYAPCCPECFFCSVESKMKKLKKKNINP